MKKRFILLCLSFLLVVNLYSGDNASLQFAVAAPDPVIAGEEVIFQILSVNSGNTIWQKGSYYWIAEIYTLENQEPKFMTKTSPVTPEEDVSPGNASGVRIPFTVPENLRSQRLLYRILLIKDGNIILDSGYKGFQVLEREFKPPQPKDFVAGGDITFSYKNSSPNGWDNHQGITAANIVGKISSSSFLFNTYLLHNKTKPLTIDIILLNLYTPTGVLNAGDISPSITALSMEGQGMRGVSFEKNGEEDSFSIIGGQTVKPEDPSSTTSGRYARYAFGFKYSRNIFENLKFTLDTVLNQDDKYSIDITTDLATVKPQKNIVYGGNLEWNFLDNFTFLSDYQLSSTDQNTISTDSPKTAGAFKEELKYKDKNLNLKLALSRIDTNFYSFASPSIISDRKNIEIAGDYYPLKWISFSASINKYEDNLGNDPSKTTTQQTQSNFSNIIKIGETLLNSSYMSNKSLGEPKTLQDNKTDTINFSITQPFKKNTLTISFQTSNFTDNTKISHDLSSNLLSFNGSFKLSSRTSASAGFINSQTKDKIDSSTAKNTTINANATYLLPVKSLAFQLWTTMSSTKNDSPSSPVDYNSISFNFETLWMKSKSSKITFGVGVRNKKDKISTANNSNEISFITRYTYSF